MSNKTNPLVSILIPVYNREKYILETVTSALNQDYPNIEVIVVDNKSTDKTFEILSSIKNSRLKIYQNELNIGPVRNWKKCVEKANGEYSKILWSDDLMESTFISKSLKIFDKKTAFVISNIKFIGIENNYGYNIFEDNISSIKTSKFIYNSLVRRKYPVSPGCAIFRTNDLESALLVDIPNNLNIDFKSVAIGNDLLIFLIIANKYNEVKILNEELNIFRVHNQSISNISGSEKLMFHYDYIRMYFVNNYNNKFKKQVKSLILFTWFVNFKKEPYCNYKFNNYCDLNKFSITTLSFLIIKRINEKILLFFSK